MTKSKIIQQQQTQNNCYDFYFNKSLICFFHSIPRNTNLLLSYVQNDSKINIFKQKANIFRFDSELIQIQILDLKIRVHQWTKSKNSHVQEDSGEEWFCRFKGSKNPCLLLFSSSATVKN